MRFGDAYQDYLRTQARIAERQAAERGFIARGSASGSAFPDAFAPQPAASGDFITTWGLPIGAGIAGLVVGLGIAKLARRKRS